MKSNLIALQRCRLITILLACLFWMLLMAKVFGATLEWDANPETNILGYRVYWGNAPRDYLPYEAVFDVGNATSNALLTATGRVYYAVTAYNTEGLESDFSDEVFYDWPISPTPPMRPMNLRFSGTNNLAEIRLQRSSGLVGWQDAGVAFVPVQQVEFFRAAAPGVLTVPAVITAPVKALRFDGSKTGKLTGSPPALP